MRTTKDRICNILHLQWPVGHPLYTRQSTVKIGKTHYFQPVSSPNLDLLSRNMRKASSNFQGIVTFVLDTFVPLACTYKMVYHADCRRRWQMTCDNEQAVLGFAAYSGQSLSASLRAMRAMTCVVVVVVVTAAVFQFSFLSLQCPYKFGSEENTMKAWRTVALVMSSGILSCYQ